MAISWPIKSPKIPKGKRPKPVVVMPRDRDGLADSHRDHRPRVTDCRLWGLGLRALGFRVGGFRVWGFGALGTL